MTCRKIARKLGFALSIGLVIISITGDWFVHHPREWIDDIRSRWPRFVVDSLLYFGNPVGDVSDALGITGEDVTFETKTAAPINSVAFAGLPVRSGQPAPEDLKILDKGDFIIGWSPSHRHPIWCAYHVPEDAKFDVGKRPNFRADPKARRSPSAGAYSRSGYDRGHLAPNFAIASRFGGKAQTETFLMSNITPQTPSLNRGVWRDVEHRIAELWTRRWGEIWVIVGGVPGGQETVSGTDIHVPDKLFQIILAQKDNKIRALALVFEQSVDWNAWPTRHIVSIDEIEELTGLDFLSELPDDVEDALESRRATRLWPINFTDMLKLLSIRFKD